jgi:cell wall-associated NlpC family hydrolase
VSTAPAWRAVVRTAVAPLLAEPRAAAVQVSQYLAGHLVEAVESQDEWARVRGDDAYEGWMHTGYLTRAPGGGARQSSGARRLSLGCHTRMPGGGRRALPLGAYLGPEERLESGEAVSETEAEAHFPRAAAAVARSATEYFDGTSYQWGGVTPWGADCSGFVQSVFRLHGVRLPRDAWQQGDAGEPSRRLLTALQAGELAFFSDRDDLRITHVGLGIGGGRMAHVAIGRGGFAVERLSDGRDLYVRGLRERFRFVRQVL